VDFLFIYVQYGEVFNLPPSDAVRKLKRNILENLFSSVLSQFKNYHPSGNMKFHDLGISQSLKFRFLMETIIPSSLSDILLPILWVVIR